MGCLQSKEAAKQPGGKTASNKQPKEPKHGPEVDVILRDEDEVASPVTSVTNDNFTFEDIKLNTDNRDSNVVLLKRDLKSDISPRTPRNTVVITESRERPNTLGNDIADLRTNPSSVSLRKRLSHIAKQTTQRTNSLTFEPATFSYQKTRTGELTESKMMKWKTPNTGFEKLLSSSAGRKLFDKFLQKEFSSENLQFWIACDNLKAIKDHDEFLRHVDVICKIYILPSAHDEVATLPSPFPRSVSRAG
jgi:hypothetical protein